MNKSVPAYLFLVGLSLSACSDKNLQAPTDQSLASHQANAAVLSSGEDAFDYPFSPDQYVGKKIQIETPADSSERPERKRFEASGKEIQEVKPEEPEAGFTSMNYAYMSSFENSFLADAARPTTYTFVSSENVGMVTQTQPSTMQVGFGTYPNYIYDIQIAKGGSSSVSAKQGFHKLNLDLNRGAGGRYIYLTFSRTQAEFSEFNQDVYPFYMKFVHQPGSMYPYSQELMPLNNITARGYRTTTIGTSPPSGFYDAFQFVSNITGPYNLKYWKTDLNDGAGGRYIRPYKSRVDGRYGYLKEVGVVAGNSSNIWPPSGWIRDNQDLNEGAGGDYIYFCYKR
ncbi:hypothetical protein E5K00_05240 [Hymenobacter aquaticus]|uniref:MABP domain-containing protein n=1 Tax=Hymenobacter aquaticus TaxID=1867101 RepID=A0A4Z0Q3L9_9BACT|nr:hypothetical protein [Hymenobacter aquaticus]TGE24620.1 hypothetical protein E5K00_05240 [Hymenobacter aquaticus]